MLVVLIRRIAKGLWANRRVRVGFCWLAYQLKPKGDHPLTCLKRVTRFTQGRGSQLWSISGADFVQHVLVSIFM